MVRFYSAHLSQLAWIGFLLFSPTGPTNAKQTSDGIPLQNFLRTYLDRSEDLHTRQLEVEIAKARLGTAQDTLQSTLEITPSYRLDKTTRSYSGLSSTRNSSDLSVRLVQGTPFGAQFNLKVTQALIDQNERDVLSTGIVDRAYSLGVSQPLWKNFFGRSFRLSQEEAGARLQAEMARLKRQKLVACQEAVGLFTTAWLAQERVGVLEEISITSKSALDSTENAGRARLVRRLDLLSARADHLRVRDLLLQAQDARADALAALKPFFSEVSGGWNEQASGKMGSGTYEDASSQLQDPSEHFSSRGLDTSIRDLEETSAVASLKLNASAAAATSRVARENAKSDISLGLEAGQTQGRLPYLTTTEDYRESYAKVSVTLSLPLVNKSLSNEIARAEALRGQAVAALDKTRRESVTTLVQLSSDISLLDSQSKISAERASLLQEQIREAFGLMRTGRMEFQDYLRYRDQYLNEKLKTLELRRDLWIRKASLAVMTDQETYVCGGAQ